VFGVGVGQAKQNRALWRAGLAHNEWTRLLAEHGVFGLLSMLVLLAVMAGSLIRARGHLEKAVVVGLVVWGAAFLAVNDMRIVAPSFFMGLACATFGFSTGWRPSVGHRRPGAQPLPSVRQR
jgi:cell division protein FtsW (lipid II flippase)